MRSAEVREVARSLTTLALIRAKQGGALNIRQRENLRRALAEAGETLGWAEAVAHSEDPVREAASDVKKMMRSGARSLKREVTDELAAIKTEEKRLEAVVVSVQELAEDPEGSYPTEITYSHTGMDATQGLMTKIEIVTVTDRNEALQAAQTIERSMGKWGRMREQLQVELKLKQKNLGVITDEVSHLVESWQGLLREVLFTLS